VESLLITLLIPFFSESLTTMSCLKWLFGKMKEKVPDVTLNESLRRLRKAESLLMKKQEGLEHKIEAQFNTASRHGMKNKYMALRALKAKKVHEAEIQRVDVELTAIQAQINNLENLSINSEVLKALGIASKILKKAHNNMDVDQARHLLENIAEQHELANKIAAEISTPYESSVDESELLAELSAIEQDKLDNQFAGFDEGLSDGFYAGLSAGLSAAKKSHFPAFPIADLSKMKVTADEGELQKPKAWPEFE